MPGACRSLHSPEPVDSLAEAYPAIESPRLGISGHPPPTAAVNPILAERIGLRREFKMKGNDLFFLGQHFWSFQKFSRSDLATCSNALACAEAVECIHVIGPQSSSSGRR